MEKMNVCVRPGLREQTIESMLAYVSPVLLGSSLSRLL